MIYRDDRGVLCRCWNWREAERTKLTEGTRTAFLCLELLPPTDPDLLRAACDDLAGAIEDVLGGTAEVTILGPAQSAPPFAR